MDTEGKCSQQTQKWINQYMGKQVNGLDDISMDALTGEQMEEQSEANRC